MPFGIGRGRKDDDNAPQEDDGGERASWPMKEHHGEDAQDAPSAEAPAPEASPGEDATASDAPAPERDAGDAPPPIEDPSGDEARAEAEQPTTESEAAGDDQPTADAAAGEEPEDERSRVAVVSEPQAQGDDEEFKWHTGLKRPT